MKLREISKQIREEDRPDPSFSLQGEQEISALNEGLLADFPETIFIANSQSYIFGKVQKSTLLYLIGRQREFRFQQILDSMNDGVVVVDETGRIFYANPSYVSILGVPLRRIMGKQIQDVEPASLLSRAVRERVPLTSEQQVVESIKKRISLRVMPLWDGETFLGAVSIFRDITSIHQLNQEVRQMSGIVDEYSQRIRSQEIADKMGLTSYSKEFQTTIQKAATVALTDVPLLICGEGGTGKNAMAYYLHQCSSRRDKPFLVLNCSAVPADMIEAELFGDTHHAGKLMLADGGTLFLDEVEELPLPAQSRLLYYSQPDRETGNPDSSARLPNTRIIASTSRPLEPMVEERRFRRELFFRLNTITITMPPLRERRDDIIPLANQFLSACNEKYHKDVMLSARIYHELQVYDWPGNLQELKSYVERAVILSDSDLPVTEREERREAPEKEPAGSAEAVSDRTLSEQLRDFERSVMRKALDACGGNKTKAMERLGLSRRTFYRKYAELFEGGRVIK